MSTRANETGKCPHCGTGVRFESVSVLAEKNFPLSAIWLASPGERQAVHVQTSSCPECRKIVLEIATISENGSQNRGVGLIYPKRVDRPLPPEVHTAGPNLAADFAEAVAVLPVSRKASAALSRRCLQFILVNAGGVTKRDLADQIDEVLPKLPPALAANVDAIRHVGNFAAHPLKSKQTGEVVEVEEGEAEWLLDVLEELIDFYYVAPAQQQAKRDALNSKLQKLGKPTLKQPPAPAATPTAG